MVESVIPTQIKETGGVKKTSNNVGSSRLDLNFTPDEIRAYKNRMSRVQKHHDYVERRPVNFARLQAAASQPEVAVSQKPLKPQELNLHPKTPKPSPLPFQQEGSNEELGIHLLAKLLKSQAEDVIKASKGLRAERKMGLVATSRS